MNFLEFCNLEYNLLTQQDFVITIFIKAIVEARCDKWADCELDYDVKNDPPSH